MASYILSTNIIARVFGNEVASSFEKCVGSTSGDTEKISGAPVLTSVHGLVEVSHQDGVKPSKSPRTSPPADMNMDTTDPKSFNVSRDQFGEIIKRQLDTVLEENSRHSQSVTLEGRLGPDIVKYDVGSHVGSFIITNDRLGVTSQCNFGSVKACTCVYKGKWQYEVQLGSKGVMQLGWATLETKFSQEKGVGDTFDSYAYDGNRIRKWNKTTSPYGETWQAGDIIGCCIDLDDGKIEFYRNGKSMGIAFTGIRRGPGVAYFPAASLAYGENIVTNFGATPFQYLVEGYSPLQLQSTINNSKTDLILGWLNNVLSLYPANKFYPDFTNARSPDYLSLLVITNRLAEFLGPHLQSGYVVEQSFFPFFAKCLGLPERVTHSDIISAENISFEKTDLLLDVMWTFLEEPEIKACLEKLCIVLMNQFRCNSLSLAYPHQQHSLMCLLALTRHRATRRQMIRSLLFDKTKIMHFLHIRPMDETVFQEVIPVVWWPGMSPENSSAAAQYERTCEVIHSKINDIQNLQTNLLKNLMINSDGTEKRPSSRALFLKKFRLFIRDVVRPGSVLHQPVSKAMATFFCFMRTIAELYAEEVDRTGENHLPDIPTTLFYDTSVSFYEMERVGGLASYLYKVHHKEVSQALSIPDYISPPTAADTAVIHRIQNPMHPGTPMPSSPTQILASDDHATLAAPTPISVTVPLVPNEMDSADEQAEGILSMDPGPAINLSRIASRSPMPPPPSRNIRLPSTTERDENGGINVSATSSGEDVSNQQVGPLGAGALLAGTPSGHHVFMPMFAEFRNLMYPRELGFGFPQLQGGLFGSPGMDPRHSVAPHNPAVALLGKESGTMDVRASLRELLDDVIIIYSCGVQRHLEKVVGLRSTMEDYVKALDRANASLKNPSLGEHERAEIQKSIDIFTVKLEEQARHIAWVKSAVFTKERQEHVFQLLKTVLATLKSSSAEGPLFTFVPEHYISTLINLTWCLLTQMHPTVSLESLPGLKDVLTDVAEFVATHFADTRIIIAETKDILTQALSSFICNRTMLTALEEMPEASQVTMVKAILRPYENRAWAQSNWMLVRFWQGSGYGFQYPNATEARRSFRAKPVQDEFGISTNLPPTPSTTLQHHVANVLIDSQKFAVSYVHSVLNQLNWAFSEFVGLLQEIQNAAQRPERVFIESRQLKICCTCFELTQALLRVMEMVTTIASPIMTDFSRESAEPILARLCMLLSQILNRIGSNTGCFAQVIELDIPGLENVTHYPLLSAVGGILVSLIEGEVDKTDETDLIATKTLINEPSFQSDSLNFFLGRNQANVPEGRKIFGIQNHTPNDVTPDEVSRLERVITHLQLWATRLQDDSEDPDDDNMCTICYAHEKNTTFKPCNHRACKPCILHHLMNRGECFFCKAQIQQVFTDDGAKIHDIETSKKSDESAIRRMMI